MKLFILSLTLLAGASLKATSKSCRPVSGQLSHNSFIPVPKGQLRGLAELTCSNRYEKKVVHVTGYYGCSSESLPFFLRGCSEIRFRCCSKEKDHD